MTASAAVATAPVRNWYRRLASNLAVASALACLRGAPCVGGDERAERKTEGGRSAGRWEITHTHPSLFVRGVLSWWSVSLAYPRAGRRARDLLDGHVNINNSALVAQPKSTLAAMPWPRMTTGLVLAFTGRTPAKPQP